MKLVNLTPHPITLVGTGFALTLPSEGQVRCQQTQQVIDSITTEDGHTLEVRKTQYGEIQGLPEPQTGVVLIVSAIVAQAVALQFPERDDVCIVTDTVRDDAGRIIGARALGRI